MAAHDSEQRFTFPSSEQGRLVHAVAWIPEEVPLRALIQISHGMAEHIDRYREVALWLNRHGIGVFGHDHLGHGRTSGAPEHLGFFADRNGWQRLTDDVHTLYLTMKDRYPGIPVFLLGHSFGSFVARVTVIRYPDAGWSGLLLSGTAHRPSLLYRGTRVLFRLVRALRGAHHRPILLDRMLFGGYNRPFRPARTPHDWLSRDPDIVDAYRDDPYCGFVFTASGYVDLMTLLTRMTDPGLIARMPSGLPVMLLSGGQDPVGRMGRDLPAAQRAFRAAGVQEVTCRILPGARHEILNETDRQQTWETVLAWCADHGSAAESPAV